MSSTESSWRPVCNGTPQGSVTGSVLFSLFICDLDECTECTLCKFTDYTKLGWVVGIPEDCVAIQQDTGRMEWWTEKNIMKFNKVNDILGWIRKSAASSQVRFPFPFILPWWDNTQSTESTSGLLNTKRHRALRVNPTKGYKDEKRLEHFSSKERLRQLGLFNLEKRRLTWNLINVCKYLTGGYQQDGVRLFP